MRYPCSVWDLGFRALAFRLKLLYDSGTHKTVQARLASCGLFADSAWDSGPGVQGLGSRVQIPESRVSGCAGVRVQRCEGVRSRTFVEQ